MVVLEKSVGSGRAVVVIYSAQNNTKESNALINNVETLSDSLKENATVHIIRVDDFSDNHIESYANQLLNTLVELKVRQSSFITFGRCSMLLWALSVIDQKRVRNALVINGETHGADSEKTSGWFARYIQKVESFLPLGLPFRVSEGKFYALPFLERFRFPVIVVVQKSENERVLSQSLLLAKALPIAWYMELEEESGITEKLVGAYKTLLKIPAKRPQKRRKQVA